MVSISTVARMVPRGMPSVVLRQVEDVVPQPGLQVALQLGQVEVGPAAALQQLAGVVEEVEAEVEQPAGHGLAVDQHVLLDQVPAARAAPSARRPCRLSRYCLPSGLV